MSIAVDSTIIAASREALPTGVETSSTHVKDESERNMDNANVTNGNNSDTNNDSKQIEVEDDATLGNIYGKICPIDTINGQVMTPCQEVRPMMGTATSTEIQSVAVCYDTNGTVHSFAVIAHDQTKFLQFTTLVGSRLVVYKVAKRRHIDLPYDGWASIYSEPTLSGRPVFSADCNTVYTTWVTNPKFGSTLAVSTATSTIDGSEIWRSNVEDGTGGINNRRFAGFTVSKDGNTSLYSATNLPESLLSSSSNQNDTSISSLVRTMGVYALDATNGNIVQEYLYNDDRDHNAYTNLVLDDTDNSYHVDKSFGLVKFDGSNLAKGPVWKTGNSKNSVDLPSDVLIRRQLLDNAHITYDGDHRILTPKPVTRDDKLLPHDSTLVDQNRNNQVQTSNSFTQAYAYRPALDGSSTTVYSFSSESSTGLAGVGNALDVSTGEAVWTTRFEAESKGGGVTDDTMWGPTVNARGDNGGVFSAAGRLIQCHDGQDGEILWTYELDAGSEGMGTTTEVVSKMVVVSDRNILLASSRNIEMLQTTIDDPTTGPPVQPTIPTLPPGPTSPLPPPASRMPFTLPPVSSPSSGPVDSPTAVPISSAIRARRTIMDSLLPMVVAVTIAFRR